MKKYLIGLSIGLLTMSAHALTSWDWLERINHTQDKQRHLAMGYFMAYIDAHQDVTACFPAHWNAGDKLFFIMEKKKEMHALEPTLLRKSAAMDVMFVLGEQFYPCEKQKDSL